MTVREDVPVEVRGQLQVTPFTPLELKIELRSLGLPTETGQPQGIPKPAVILLPQPLQRILLVCTLTTILLTLKIKGFIF